MAQDIQVACIISRYWYPDAIEFEGEEVAGTLIDFSTGTAHDGSGRIVPVGIVLLEEENTFHSVPMEFILRNDFASYVQAK